MYFDKLDVLRKVDSRYNVQAMERTIFCLGALLEGTGGSTQQYVLPDIYNQHLSPQD
jgi:hypothetical protein